MRWCVLKQVRMWVSSCVSGSQSCRWRRALLVGKSLADGCSDPSRQKSGFAGGATVEVSQSRPRSSSIGLWTLFLLVQMTSSPQ